MTHATNIRENARATDNLAEYHSGSSFVGSRSRHGSDGDDAAANTRPRTRPVPCAFRCFPVSEQLSAAGSRETTFQNPSETLGKCKLANRKALANSGGSANVCESFAAAPRPKGGIASRRVQMFSLAPLRADAEMREKYSTAIHEAGHAVVAGWFDLLEDSAKISIDPGDEDDWAGVCEVNHPVVRHEFDICFPPPSDPQFLERIKRGEVSLDGPDPGEEKRALYREQEEHNVMVFLAGYEAERIQDPSSVDDSESPDSRAAQNLIELLVDSRSEPGDCEEQEQAYWQWLLRRVQLILEVRWDCVVAVADRLNERRTISGGEIAEVIFATLAKGDSLSDVVR